jgi:hypothetical protein
MSRFKLLVLPGALALVLSFPLHAVGAEAPSRSSDSSHVLVGMTPNADFQVTCDDSLVFPDPVTSDGLGILGFTIDGDDFPDGGIVRVRPAATAPEVLDCTIGTLDTSAVFFWHTDRPALSHIEYGTSSGHYPYSSEEQPVLAVEHSAVLAPLTPETTYFYRLVSTDAFGNQAVTDELSFDTCPLRPDIVGTTAEDVAETSFRVVWTTSTPADSRVEYGRNESCDDGAVSLPDLVTSHDVSVEGLWFATTYYFRARSVDECGCEVVSDVLSVTTVPEVVRIIAVSLLDVTSTTAAIRWWTNVPSTSQIVYGTTPSYGHSSAFEADLTTSHLVVLDGLSPETLYHFRTLSVDAEGREASSEDLAFTTEPADTPQRLSIYNVVVHVAEEGTAATVGWITNLPSTSLVEYGRDTGYGSSVADSREVTQHSVVLNALEPGTLYHFRVASSAGAGIDAVSDDMVLSTQGVGDSSPPMAPEGLTATSTEFAVNLSWEPTPDGDLAGYTLYKKREGQLLHSTVAAVPAGQTTYSDVDVRPGTYYEYVVAARDVAGNESGLSEAVRVMAGASVSGRIWVFPNPMVDHTSIRFALPQSPRAPSGSSLGGYTLRIYDVAGRLVRALDGTSPASEPRTVPWDVTDDGGRRVASGTYFCVVANWAGALRTKLLVLR